VKEDVLNDELDKRTGKVTGYENRRSDMTGREIKELRSIEGS